MLYRRISLHMKVQTVLVIFRARHCIFEANAFFGSLCFGSISMDDVPLNGLEISSIYTVFYILRTALPSSRSLLSLFFLKLNEINIYSIESKPFGRRNPISHKNTERNEMQVGRAIK